MTRPQGWLWTPALALWLRPNEGRFLHTLSRANERIDTYHATSAYQSRQARIRCTGANSRLSASTFASGGNPASLPRC
jgi:hypothetical protein